MRTKRFDKKMLFMLAPALACSLTAGVQTANADNYYDLGSLTEIFNDDPVHPLPFPLTNGDTLSLAAGGLISATSSINALQIDPNATGVTILNSGTIRAENAAAIFVEATAAGTTVTNSGEISTYGSGSDISIAAIYFAGDLDASLTNNGTISATVDNGSSFAAAAGIAVGDLSGTLTINDTGTVTASVTVTGDDANANAVGILIGSTSEGDFTATPLAGTLTNSGSIAATANANATGQASAFAYGVAMGSLPGTLNNGGVITATATATANGAEGFGSALAAAGGIIMGTTVEGSLVGGTLSGTLTNSGTISAIATALTDGNRQASAFAHGILAGDLTGTLTNSTSGTITAAATATANGNDSAYASAYGISLGAVTSDLTLDNSGTITATATANSTDNYATAYAYGIAADDISGTLINRGAIKATATATDNASSSYAHATAYGIQMGALSGALTNSGTITATATALGSSAYVSAYGIQMGTLSGALTNSGSIEATSVATGVTDRGTAHAYGISMSNLTGTLTNSGDIEVTATAIDVADYGEAYAYGISIGTTSMGNFIGGDLTGTLDNNGTIKATASASQGGATYAYAYAYGIAMGNLIGEETLNNSGTISATANVQVNSYYGYANAYGITMGELSGVLDNSGTIEATANGQAANSHYAYVYAYGLTMGDLTGTLNNSGTIKATASNQGEGGVHAKGISLVDGNLDGQLINSNLISATATANSGENWGYATAYGVDMVNLTGFLGNSGVINATATANGADGAVWAYGIRVDNIGGVILGKASETASAFAEYAGNLVNTGDITATGTGAGDSGYAYAYGVLVSNNLYGVLVNAGSITATANGSVTSVDESEAFGVYINTLDGTLDNYGTIAGIATIPENGYSLRAVSGSGTVYNNAGALLSGNLWLGGSISLYNSGTVALPVMEEGMVAYINGNYTQDEDGILSFDADKISLTDPMIYGRLDVMGTASFAPNTTLHVNLIPGNNIPVGTTLTSVVSASNILEDSTFTVTDNSALLAFTYDFSGQGEIVDLTMNQVSAAGMVGAAGWGSAVGAAGALDYMLGLYGTEDEYTEMHNFLAALRAMPTDAQVAQTIVTTLPSLRLELSQLTLENSHKNVDFTRQRDDVARGMSSGSSIASNSNLWIGTFGSWANQDSADGAFGYDADTFGVMLGGDVAWGSRARIGLGLAFHKSDVDGDTLAEQTADIKSYQPMLYGSYLLDDQVDIKWHLGYGWHDNETTRFIPLYGATVKGDYDASSINAGVAVSKPYKMDEKTTFTPSVRLDYAYIDNDSYNETGAGPLSLRVGSSDVDQLILGLDGKIDHALNQDWKVAARLGIGYDMIADEDSLTAAYAGAPGVAFSTYGTEPSSFLYRGGLGVTYGQKDSLQVSLNYDLEGREDFTNQSVSLKLGFNF